MKYLETKPQSLEETIVKLRAEKDMSNMCCKNCGDMFGKPTAESSCQYNAYNPMGENWIKKESYKEEIELEEKTECPECEGKGCDHCDDKGYHTEEVQIDEEKVDPQLRRLFRLGLVDKDKMSKAVRAFKDPEKSMKNKQLRGVMIDVLQKLLKMVEDDPQLYQKTRSTLQKEEKDEVDNKIKRLVRMGLADKENIQKALRALKDPDKASLNPQLRKTMLNLLQKLLDMHSDKMIYQRIRKNIQKGSKKEVEEAVDPVNKKAVKKDFDDREDKDIDNDGDVDSSDEYLHKRRKAIKKAMSENDDEEEMDPTKHVAKKGDMYCVYNKAGKEVAKFDNEEEANAYARKNHDALMGKEEMDEAAAPGSTAQHGPDAATTDSYDKQLATRGGEKEFADKHTTEVAYDAEELYKKNQEEATAALKRTPGRLGDKTDGDTSFVSPLKAEIIDGITAALAKMKTNS